MVTNSPKTFTKTNAREALRKKLHLPRTTRAILIDRTEDQSLKDFLWAAAEALDIALVHDVDHEDLYGYDAVVTDRDTLGADA